MEPGGHGMIPVCHITILYLLCQIFFVDASEKVRNTYLKVVEDPLGPNTNETIHLIPLVQDIVPSLVLVAKKVMLTPPDGLLDIGKSKANIAELGTELAEFTTYPCGCFGDRLGVKYMPTKRALKNAGRDDLVAAVEECGGFVVVAGELGWTTHRKPPGEHCCELDLQQSEIFAREETCHSPLVPNDEL